MSQGGIANSSGKTLEVAVASMLDALRIGYVPQHKIGRIGLLKEEVVIDFYLPDHGMYIECKRQESDGSANQKCGYVMLSVLEGVYDKPLIVVLEGAVTDNVYIFYKDRESDGIRVKRLGELMTLLEQLSTGLASFGKQYDPNQRKLF